MNSRVLEVQHKLARTREVMLEHSLKALRFHGVGWFAWWTAGGSNVIEITSDTGIAQVLITLEQAFILTDVIEAERLREEELTGLNGTFELIAVPWAEHEMHEVFVQNFYSSSLTASDRPCHSEQALPKEVWRLRRTLTPKERDRLREVGSLASQAMSEVLRAATPTMTELELAATGSAALMARGLTPAVILAAGERRLPRYRHAPATPEKLGGGAMLVFCARGQGLIANLTRFVTFKALSKELEARHSSVREIEVQVLNATRIGGTLAEPYRALERAYAEQGFADQILKHHQGGLAGYATREVLANAHSSEMIEPWMAFAWNPSVLSAKIEDTFLLHPTGVLEDATFDPSWPSVMVAERKRPIPFKIDVP